MIGGTRHPKTFALFFGAGVVQSMIFKIEFYVWDKPSSKDFLFDHGCSFRLSVKGIVSRAHAREKMEKRKMLSQKIPRAPARPLCSSL